MSFEELDAAARGGVLFAHIVNGLAGVDHGAVVTTAEVVTDFLEGMFGENAGEIHRDLAGDGDVVGPAFAGHVAVPNLKMVGDTLLDRLDGQDRLDLLHQDVVQQAFGCGDVHRLARECRVARDLNQRALEAADVLRDILRNEIKNGLREVAFQGGCLGAQNGLTGLEVGCLNVGGQAPFKTRYEAGFEFLDFAGAAVAGEDDLFSRFKEIVEMSCEEGFRKNEAEVVHGGGKKLLSRWLRC